MVLDPHVVIVAVLLLVLTAALCGFGALGMLHSRRAGALRRDAHEMGLRFSSEDPFDLPGRYAEFALVDNGHSPVASNVSYGRMDGLAVRAFDFRYEIGHGTRRQTCHYDVVVFETDTKLPGTLMWHREDIAFAPLPARQIRGLIGQWTYCGDGQMAARLSAAWGSDVCQGVSMQSRSNAIMMCRPARRVRQRYTQWLKAAIATACAIVPKLEDQAEAERQQMNLGLSH
jgi:hypothetical protein